MAQSDFPDCTCRFLPRWSLRFGEVVQSWGGGGGTPTVVRCSDVSLAHTPRSGSGVRREEAALQLLLERGLHGGQAVVVLRVPLLLARLQLLQVLLQFVVKLHAPERRGLGPRLRLHCACSTRQGGPGGRLRGNGVHLKKKKTSDLRLKKKVFSFFFNNRGTPKKKVTRPTPKKKRIDLRFFSQSTYAFLLKVCASSRATSMSEASASYAPTTTDLRWTVVSYGMRSSALGPFRAALEERRGGGLEGGV